MFGVFCAVMTVHIFFMYPETQGKTLEEIDFLFESKVKPWKSNKVQSGFEERMAQVAQKEAMADSDGPELDGKSKDKVEHKEAV